MAGIRPSQFVGSINTARVVGSGIGFPAGSLRTDSFGFWPASLYDSANTRIADASGKGIHLSLAAGLAAPQFLAFSGSRALYLPGVTGNYGSAPDSNPTSVTGNLELEFHGTADDWTPTVEPTLIAKWQAAALSYALSLLSTGGLRLRVSNTSATATHTANSTAVVPFTNGSFGAIVVTLNVSTGQVQFYTSPDGSTWSQLGSNVNVGAVTGGISNTAAPVEVGSESGGGGVFQGRIHRARIRNGIGGTIVFDAVASTLTEPYATWTESSSNAAAVTLNRGAVTSKQAAVVDRDMFIVDNTDYFEHADNSNHDFGASESFTVSASFRTYNVAAATSPTVLAKKADATAATAGWMLDFTGSSARFTISDGTTQVQATASLAGMNGRAITVTGVRNVATDQIVVYVDDTPGTAVTDTTTGTLANAQPLQAARGASGQAANVEFFGGGVWRKALTAAEVGRLPGEFGTNV